jgi:hypothetical protein
MLSYKMTVGSRAQVFNGTKDRTSGGLKREDLFRGKDGRIKSKRASKLAKKNNRLVKAGYVTERGKFGAVRVEDAKSPRRSARRSSSRRPPPKRSSSRRGRSPARRSSSRRGSARRSSRRR